MINAWIKDLRQKKNDGNDLTLIITTQALVWINSLVGYREWTSWENTQL